MSNADAAAIRAARSEDAALRAAVKLRDVAREADALRVALVAYAEGDADAPAMAGATALMASLSAIVADMAVMDANR